MPRVMQTAGSDAVYSKAVAPELISEAVPAMNNPALFRTAESYGASTAAELGAQALADPSLVAAGAEAGVAKAGLLDTMGKGFFPLVMAALAIGQAGSDERTSIGQLFNASRR